MTESLQDPKDLLPKGADGYADARVERVFSFQAHVRGGEVGRTLVSERSGHMVRFAGEEGFRLAGDSKGPMADTAFSRFVRDTFEGVTSEQKEAAAAEPEAIPTDVIAAAAELSSDFSCRLYWETRQVNWANTPGLRRRRLDATRLARIDFLKASRGRVIQLRRFLHDPSVDDVLRVGAEFTDLAGVLRSAEPADPVGARAGGIVLHPSVAAVLIHEVAGHFCESDWAPAGVPSLGEKVSGADVTVEDRPDDFSAVAAHRFDDEGVDAIPVTLLREGVWEEALHSLESAFRSKRRPNGRGRARDFRYEPKTRMTNLRLRSGRVDPLDLIRDAGDGLFMAGSLGAISSGGVFSLACQYGYRIVNGVPAAPVLRPSLHGDRRAILGAIRGVASDSVWCADGGCLSGDQFTYRSGRGAPHVLISFED